MTRFICNSLYFLGCLFVFVFMVVCFASFVIAKDSTKIDLKKMPVKTDTVVIRDTILSNNGNEIKISMDEKFSSLNSRLTDFYYVMGLILALITVMLVSLYFKTGAEAKKYMEDNFSVYQDEITKINANAKEILTELKAQQELASKLETSKPDSQSTKQSPE